MLNKGCWWSSVIMIIFLVSTICQSHYTISCGENISILILQTWKPNHGEMWQLSLGSAWLQSLHISLYSSLSHRLLPQWIMFYPATNRGENGVKRIDKTKQTLPGELFFPFNMVYGFAFIINILLMRTPTGEGWGVRFSMKSKHCRK